MSLWRMSDFDALAPEASGSGVAPAAFLDGSVLVAGAAFGVAAFGVAAFGVAAFGVAAFGVAAFGVAAAGVFGAAFAGVAVLGGGGAGAAIASTGLEASTAATGQLRQFRTSITVTGPPSAGQNAPRRWSRLRDEIVTRCLRPPKSRSGTLLAALHRIQTAPDRLQEGIHTLARRGRDREQRDVAF